MSRSSTATLNTAIASDYRKPYASAVIRDTRIRFQNNGLSQPWTSASTPWNAQDNASFVGTAMVPQDACVVDSAGSIARVAYGASGGLYVNFITDPTNDDQWSNWQYLEPSATYGSPGIVYSSGSLTIYYVNANTLYTLTSSSLAPLTWQAPVSTGVTFPAATYPTCAPLSAALVYAALAYVNRIRIFRISLSGGVWTSTEAPWSWYGNSAQAITSNSVDSSFFDAFKLDANDFETILFTHYTGGQVYKARYTNGIFSPPQLFWPTYNDTTNSFVLYRVIVTNLGGGEQAVWATGREMRTLPTQSVLYDVYARSTDGWNFTSMPRNSFLCEAEIRGCFLPTNDYIYYAGLANIYRAPNVYGVNGSDPAGKKIVVSGDDIIAGSISFPSAGTSPQVDLDLANGKNQWIIPGSGSPSDIARRGSEVWVSMGYQTTSGSPETLVMDHAGLDTVHPEIGQGIRVFQITARDAAYKALRTWVSPYFWDYRSQLKHQGLDSLSPGDGIGGWTTTSGSGGPFNPGPWGPNGPVSPVGNKNSVFAADQAHIKMTTDFLDPSPHWLDITSGVFGTITDFIFDPWDVSPFSHNGTTLSVVYLTSSTGVYKTTNIRTAAPSWEEVLSASQFGAATGATLDTFAAVRSTIAQQDLIYVLALAHIGSTYYAYLCTTSKGGDAWYFTQIGVTTSATDVHGLAASQHNAALVWAACGAGALYHSVDYGVSFSELYTVLAISKPIANIEVPYQGNPSDSTLYIGGPSAASGVAGSGYLQTFLSGQGHFTNSIDPVTGYMVIAKPYWVGYYAEVECEIAFQDGGIISDGNINVYNLHGAGGTGVLYIFDQTAGTYALVRSDPSWYSGSISVPSITGHIVTYIDFITGSIYGGFGWIQATGVPAASSGYIRRSDNGGATFSDITPASVGASTPRSLQTDCTNGAHLTAILGGSQIAETYQSAWTTLTSGLSDGTAIGRWPYDSTTLYFMDANHVYFSLDNGATLQDKTGDWGSLSGPVNIIPIYVGA